MQGGAARRQAAFVVEVVEDERVRGDVVDEPGGVGGDVEQVVGERGLFGEQGDVVVAAADGGDEVEDAGEAVKLGVLYGLAEDGRDESVQAVVGLLWQTVPVVGAGVGGEGGGGLGAAVVVADVVVKPAREVGIVRVGPVHGGEVVGDGGGRGGVFVGDGRGVVLVDGVARLLDARLQGGDARDVAGGGEALPGAVVIVVRQAVGLLVVAVLQGIFDAAQGEVGVLQGLCVGGGHEAARADVVEGGEE